MQLQHSAKNEALDHSVKKITSLRRFCTLANIIIFYADMHVVAKYQ